MKNIKPGASIANFNNENVFFLSVYIILIIDFLNNNKNLMSKFSVPSH